MAAPGTSAGKTAASGKDAKSSDGSDSYPGNSAGAATAEKEKAEVTAELAGDKKAGEKGEEAEKDEGEEEEESEEEEEEDEEDDEDWGEDESEEKDEEDGQMQFEGPGEPKPPTASQDLCVGGLFARLPADIVRLVLGYLRADWLCWAVAPTCRLLANAVLLDDTLWRSAAHPLRSKETREIPARRKGGDRRRCCVCG